MGGFPPPFVTGLSRRTDGGATDCKIPAGTLGCIISCEGYLLRWGVSCFAVWSS